MPVVLLCVALASFLGSGAVVGLVARRARARGWLDRDHGRAGGPAYRPVPRLGGIGVLVAIATGAVVASALGALGAQWMVVVGIAAGVGLVGIVDDMRPLPPALKAAALGLGAAASLAAGIHIDLDVLGLEVRDGTAVAVTVLWFIAVPTAFNFIDGLDGLAAGTALVALAGCLLVALVAGAPQVALVVALSIGAVGGFLRHNRHPARIFMGDGGAMLIGYLVAACCAALTQAAEASMASSLIALVALPLIDFALAMVRRLRRGQPFSSDGQHLHHRVANAVGHSHAVVVLLAAATACAAASFAVTAPEVAAAVLGAGVACCYYSSERTAPVGALRLAPQVVAVAVLTWGLTTSGTGDREIARAEGATAAAQVSASGELAVCRAAEEVLP